MVPSWFGSWKAGSFSKCWGHLVQIMSWLWGFYWQTQEGSSVSSFSCQKIKLLEFLYLKTFVSDTASDQMPAFCKPLEGDVSSYQESFTGALDTGGRLSFHSPVMLHSQINTVYSSRLTFRVSLCWTLFWIDILKPSQVTDYQYDCSEK